MYRGRAGGMWKATVQGPNVAVQLVLANGMISEHVWRLSQREFKRMFVPA